MRWLHRWLNRKVLDALYDERLELARIIKQEPYIECVHPHTWGMYDGLNKAITLIEDLD